MMDLQNIVKNKDVMYKEYEKGLKELESKYYDKLVEAERNLREARSERDRILFNFRLANDLEKNKEWKKLKETEEDIFLLIYFKYIQLRGGFPSINENVINQDIIDSKILVHNDWCKLNYIHFKYMKYRKWNYEVYLNGKCILPNKILLYLNGGDYYLDSIEIPKSLQSGGKDWKGLSIGKLCWMSSRFHMEFKVKSDKNMPLYKKCKEIADFISEINKRVYEKLWDKAKRTPIEEIKELLKGDQRHYILETLNNRFDVNLKDFSKLIEGE